MVATQLDSRDTTTSMATGKGVSRLGMMQARLQEQLMVEKESRLLEMAARQEAERDSTIQRVTKSSASSLSSSLSSLSLGSTLSGQGKVRKMFEDRRSTGYDKSYPLNPVRSGGPTKAPTRGVVRSPGSNLNARGNSSDRGAGASYGGGYGQQRSRSQVAPAAQRAASKQPTSTTRKTNNNNNASRMNHHKSNPSLLEANNQYNNNSSGSSYARRPSQNTVTNGMARRPSPAPPQNSEVRRQAPPKKPSPSPFKSKPAPSPTPRAPAAASRPKAPPSLAPSPMPRKGSTASAAPATPRKVPPGMAQCRICERCFNPDRIDKHTEICKKSQAKAKKRKVFDPVKMRNKGTEAEKYIARGSHLKEVKAKKKDWRKQHEDFIATVRAAKGIKGYEAPPLDTSDYVQCPHCGRKFNEAAAERHIPKCQDIKSNKKR